MSNAQALQEFDRLINQGAHVLIVTDAAETTVQPLTRQGHDALYSAFRDSGLGHDELRVLSRKRGGHYLAAVPVDAAAEAVATALIKGYGLPDGSVAISKVDFEITPVGINERVQ